MKNKNPLKWRTKTYKWNSNSRRICGIVIKMIATNSVNLFLYSSKSLYENESARISRIEIRNGKSEAVVA